MAILTILFLVIILVLLIYTIIKATSINNYYKSYDFIESFDNSIILINLIFQSIVKEYTY